MVHELANPLTSIVAYTEYLLQKAERRGDDPEDIERLRRVGDAADLILSFTRAIVSYAKPGDDIPCPVDAVQAIDQALLFCKHIVDDSRVTIKHQIEPDLPYVRSVRGQLIQVIVNLVANACQAMAPRGGTLTLRAHAIRSNRVVLLHVEDTGPGIDPEHIDRVFDPFFTTKGEGVGTGLGLNIVRQIVARGEGTVSVESHPGKGACFVVTLPMHDCEQP
ncbi:MAG: HAMP domain-containing sensor histidine kinase [Coriobacteriia bacterium]|nr:HAMP domain-containing sensor histidine kinase [Coriobacteriia bacterium]